MRYMLYTLPPRLRACSSTRKHLVGATTGGCFVQDSILFDSYLLPLHSVSHGLYRQHRFTVPCIRATLHAASKPVNACQAKGVHPRSKSTTRSITQGTAPGLSAQSHASIAQLCSFRASGGGCITFSDTASNNRFSDARVASDAAFETVLIAAFFPELFKVMREWTTPPIDKEWDVFAPGSRCTLRGLDC